MHRYKNHLHREYEAVQPAFDDWYLAQLKPNGYERAKLNLDRQGFQTFMPLRAATVRFKGRLTSRLRPLFQGYIFIHIRKQAPDWRSIKSTYGVARLVALSGDRPSQVAPALMQALFDRTGPDGTWKAPEDLKTGDTVRMISGPFAATLGQVEDVLDKDRIVLLLNLMGRCSRVQTGPDQVELA